MTIHRVVTSGDVLGHPVPIISSFGLATYVRC
jgi:hypothetical protein